MSKVTSSFQVSQNFEKKNAWEVGMSVTLSEEYLFPVEFVFRTDISPIYSQNTNGGGLQHATK